MINIDALVAALSDDYAQVYLVDPLADALSIIKTEGALKGHYGKDEEAFSYSDRLAKYASNRLLQDDKDAFLAFFSADALIARLSKERRMELTFRILLEGKILHYSGVCIRISELEEPLKVLLLFKSIEGKLRSERKKQEEGAAKAYSAISDIYVAMFRINLENDSYSVIKTTDDIAKITTSKSFKANIAPVTDELSREEYKAEVRRFMDVSTLPKRMEGKKHISIAFESSSRHECRLHFIKEETDGMGPGSILFAVEMCEESKLQSVFDALSSEYRNVFYFDLISGKGRVIKTSIDMKEASPNAEFHYPTLCEVYIDRFVVESEKDALRERLSLDNLRRFFATSGSLSGGYSAILNGSKHNYTYDFRKMKEEGFIACGFRCVDKIIEEHLKEERERRAKEEAYRAEIEENYGKLSEMKGILSSTKTGTWKLVVEKGKAPKLLADDLTERLTGLERRFYTPEALYEAWKSNIDPSYLPNVLASMKKTEKDGFGELTYLYNHPKLGPRYVRAGGTVFKTKNGFERKGYLQDVDEAVKKDLKRSAELAKASRAEKEHGEVISAISKIYTSVILADVTSGRYKIIDCALLLDNNVPREGVFNEESEDIVLNFISPDTRGDAIDFVDLSTIKSRMENANTIFSEFRDSLLRWVEARFIVKSRDEEGEVKEVLFVTRDITKEKEQEIQREKSLRDALQLASNASKAKTTFLNSMSHDIRTPMNAIIGFTALALTSLGNQEATKDYLRKIQTSSTHLLSLINEVLDMSRIESGTVKLDEKPLHLPTLFHDLRTMIQSQIAVKRQSLYIDTLDVRHEDIIADRLRLSQVLLNIASNAIKYTGAGGNIYIRVSESPCAKKGKASYRFSVKDDGIGMSAEFAKTVFDSFTREKSATVSGVQGTGLGMSIAKNIVELMGGRISVSSEQGKGSEFIVSLDFKLAESKEESDILPALLGARALVVDDDVSTCQSISKMLRDIKMRPDWSSSGKEAVVRAKEANELGDVYKAYIIDYLMPDMNGVEVVRQIRRLTGDETPIIILTAYDWRDFEEEAKEAGVTAFVSKPLFVSELRQALSCKCVEEKEAPKPSFDENSFKGKKALLVEDNALNMEIATSLLRQLGLEVKGVSDGIDAINAVQESKEGDYDVVFMDIQMPRMDGYTATREIRTLPDNWKANIPIIAMTANAFEEDRQKAFEAGMNGHISKPVSLDSIGKALSSLFADISPIE